MLRKRPREVICEELPWDRPSLYLDCSSVFTTVLWNEGIALSF
jgi:hypothetical protein